VFATACAEHWARAMGLCDRQNVAALLRHTQLFCVQLTSCADYLCTWIIRKCLFALAVTQQHCDLPSTSVTAHCRHFPYKWQQMAHKQQSSCYYIGVVKLPWTCHLMARPCGNKNDSREGSIWASDTAASEDAVSLGVWPVILRTVVASSARILDALTLADEASWESQTQQHSITSQETWILDSS
jgi:hypothetical protein